VQCHRVFDFAEDWVAGGESAKNRVVHPGAKVILAEFGIEPLAGEQEAVIKRAAFFKHLAERAVRIICHHRACIVDYLPDAAEAVGNVEVFCCWLAAVTLTDDLACIGVYV